MRSLQEEAVGFQCLGGVPVTPVQGLRDEGLEVEGFWVKQFPTAL